MVFEKKIEGHKEQYLKKKLKIKFGNFMFNKDQYEQFQKLQGNP